MAIQAAGEFEIIVNNILMKVQRRLDEQPRNRNLISAKRQMEETLQRIGQGKKPDAAQIKAFTEAAEAIRQAFRDDVDLSDQLFDCLDWMEYRA